MNSRTSIPAKMALAVGLPLGSAVQTNTAGGQVVDHLTHINSLKIGSIGTHQCLAKKRKYRLGYILSYRVLQSVVKSPVLIKLSQS